MTEQKAGGNDSIGVFTAVVVLAAFSMRAPMGCVGPLMSVLWSELALSAAMGGMLTTLLLLLFAFGAALSEVLSRKFGLERMIAFSFSLVLIGTVIRALETILTLFSGTIILGLGTGILNVLIPSSINEYYPYKRGLVMGIYSASLTVASALTAAFIVPLSSSLGGWKNAFLFPAIFPLSSDYLASIF